MRIGDLEERETNDAILRPELQRMRALRQSHVLDEVPNIVELFRGNPVVGPRLLVAVAEADLRKPAVVGVRGGGVVATNAELGEQVGIRVASDAGRHQACETYSRFRNDGRTP